MWASEEVCAIKEVSKSEGGRIWAEVNVGDLSSDQRRRFGLWMKATPLRNKKEDRPFEKNGGIEGCPKDRVDEENK
ncbi:hypothetical protein PTKIN_Ptkin09bG0163100 [Pterospermum kingtungense]